MNRTDGGSTLSATIGAPLTGLGCTVRNDSAREFPKVWNLQNERPQAKYHTPSHPLVHTGQSMPAEACLASSQPFGTVEGVGTSGLPSTPARLRGVPVFMWGADLAPR
jgi:hypothetical protein